MRVDGDHAGEDNDMDLEISKQSHYRTHSAAEIFIRMDKPMSGLFIDSDYDLLLVLDSEHFEKN